MELYPNENEIEAMTATYFVVQNQVFAKDGVTTAILFATALGDDEAERIAAALNAQAGVVEALVKAAEMACEAMCRDKLYVQTHARLCAALAAVNGVDRG